MIFRPKKVPSTVSATKIVHIDDDPCLNSIVAESILPLIPERAVGNSSSFGNSTTDSSSNLSSGINDNIHTNAEGAMLKGKSGGSFNTSMSSNSRYSAKGMEGTQVRFHLVKLNIKGLTQKYNAYQSITQG